MPFFVIMILGDKMKNIIFDVGGVITDFSNDTLRKYLNIWIFKKQSNFTIDLIVKMNSLLIIIFK